MDPITAFAAVQSVVKLIKKASEAADDVSSLGPLIGKYFDAKHDATKAVRESKKSGGSNMGKALEIELALKAQKDFEEQLKGLFFPNNMDVWENIMVRVAEMNAADKAEAERERVAEINRKRKQKEMEELFIALGLALVLLILFGWGFVELMDHCKTARCRI